MKLPRSGGGGPWDRMLDRFTPRQILFSLALVLATLGGVGAFFFVNRGHPTAANGRPPKAIADAERREEGEGGETARQGQTEPPPADPPAPSKVQEYEELGARAIEAFKAGRVQDAADGFTAALTLGETLDNVAAQQRTLLSNRSACLEKLGLVMEALADCAKITALEPKNAKVNKRRERLVGVLMSEGRYVEALAELMVPWMVEMDAYKQHLSMLGTSHAAMANLPMPPPPNNMDEVAKQASKQVLAQVEASRENQKVLPSAFTIKTVLRDIPSFKELQTAQGRREADEISKDLDKASKEAGSEAAVVTLLFERALGNVAEGRFKRADEDFGAALEALEMVPEGASVPWSDSTLAGNLSWAATFLHLKHDLDRARELLERACELDPSNAEIWVKRAILHLDMMDVERSKELFDRALEVQPAAAYIHFWKAQLYLTSRMMIEENSTARAEEELRKVLELDPEHVQALLRLITLKVQGTDAGEAEALMEQARRLAPRSSDVVAAHAEFLLMRNEVDEASKEIEKAIRLDPSNPMPYINKALVSCQTGDVNTAREVLQRVLDTDPLYQPAYPFLFNVEIRLVTSFELADAAFRILDKGISMSRAKEDLEESVTLKVLTQAKFEAAKKLGWTATRIAAL